MKTINNINFSELTERLNMMNFAESGSIETIVHNGVIFPEIPEYITKNYGKFSLAGDKLSDLATRMMFGWSTNRAMKSEQGLVSGYSKKDCQTFTSNFYKCLKLNLTKKQLQLSFPKDFEKLREQMNAIINKYTEDKKEYNKSHKKEIEKEKLERKEKFGYVTVNGVQYTFNPVVEAGGIFYGRPGNAYHGGWALDVQPEDVTLNSSKKIPCPIKGHHWKEVVLKPEVWSPATFDKYIQVGDKKYKLLKSIRMSNDNEQKKGNDVHKFDKARMIDLIMPKIKRAIKKKIESSSIREKQLGCCAYLVVNYGIRAGNDSGKRQNGVRGASTLLCKDIEILSPTKIHLNFPGKDSVIYDNTLKIDSYAREAIEELQEEFGEDDRIFPNITSNSVNKFFGSIDKNVPDLTCKNFRTFFASSFLTKEIQKHKDEWSADMSDKEFRNLYDKCVIEVAKMLNHKKTISKEQSDKIQASVKEKLKMIKTSLKNVKARAEARIERLENENKKLEKTKPTGYKSKIKANNEQIEELYEAIEDAERTYAAKREEQLARFENRELATGTSKSNYSNPMIAYSLAKYCEKDPKNVLSPQLVERFNSWIDFENLDEEYWLKYPNVED